MMRLASILLLLLTLPACAALIHHSDRGVQYLAMNYTQRLAEAIAGHCALPRPIHAVSWRWIADSFRDIGRDLRLNPGTRRWALGVHGFLRREDPLSLAGWEALDLAPVPPATWRFARRYFPVLDETPQLDWRFNDGWFRRKFVVEPISWSFTR